ncbi:Hypothetical protein R9X50_00631200 [Acrodontium crateriforme]|uniref:Uncharacterized protein n=1 Tax=Acrodontium crateriforme TaxID=150365 RepID=A0AAQ3M7P6_9PEZI|nr:Hypothetical protein R9X50_00631200 [Acrodontium crateriforme]
MARFLSQEVRNQVAGHLDSRTYRNNYQDQHISIDVAGLAKGQNTEDMLIRKLNNLATDADPNADIPLPLEAYEQIDKLPDVVSLRDNYRRLGECVKEKYGSIKDAPNSEELLQQYELAKRKYRAKKEFHKAQRLAQLRLDYFALKDTPIIDAQPKGSDESRKPWSIKEGPTLSIPERSALADLIGAEDMRCPVIRSQKAAAVQFMADLYSRVELRRASAVPGGNRVNKSSVEPKTM